MSELISRKAVITRKPHRCWGCTKEFPVKTSMERVTSKDMGKISTGYWCDSCMEIDAEDETDFVYGCFVEQEKV